MAIEIGELRGILSLQDKFSGPANNAAKQLGFMGKSFGTLTKVAGVAAGAITGATAAIVALGVHGSKVEGIKSSFEALSRATGESADVMLGAMRTATSGLVSDFELMSAANKAMLLGLPVTADSLGTMAQAATILGRAMKQDATKSLDDLTTALGRGSPLILDNLGLTVKVGEANKAYAKTLGKSADQLTDGEKKLAFYNAAMGAAKVKLDELGELQLSFGLRVQQAKTMVTNFVDSLSLAVATSPVVAAGMDAIMVSIQGAFGGDQQQTVKALMGYVNDFAIFLAGVAKIGIKSARFITNAFHGVRVIFNAVLEAIFNGLAKANDLVATLAQKASSLPVVGQGFKVIAEGAREVADMNAAIAFGMGEMKDKAVDAASAANAGFNAMEAAITDAETAMRSAKDTQVETTAAVADFGATTVEAVERTKESTDKIADAYRKLDEEIALIGRVGHDRRMIELALRREDELAGLAELAEVTTAEYADLVLKVEEKYRLMTAAAKLSKDEILETTRKLQEELALASTTGLEEQLLRIEFQREAEIAGIVHLREVYGEEYTAILASINEKYDQMATAATGYHDDIVKQAGDAGFKTRKELEATARLAVNTYERMRRSSEYNAGEIRKAYEAAEEAKRNALEETSKYQMTAGEAWMSGTGEILGMLGKRHKAAAIAGAILATYQAVAKAYASAPPPASFALAAIALAVGLANVNRIRSSKPGYAEGTPETSFYDFGRGSLEMLHGEESVVTRAQGENLADMLTAAVAGGKGGTTIRVPIYVDGRMLTEGIVKHIPAVLALNGVRG